VFPEKELNDHLVEDQYNGREKKQLNKIRKTMQKQNKSLNSPNDLI
jgi:hypothetical protein